jgi:hypothetical protein
LAGIQSLGIQCSKNKNKKNQTLNKIHVGEGVEGRIFNSARNEKERVIYYCYYNMITWIKAMTYRYNNEIIIIDKCDK